MITGMLGPIASKLGLGHQGTAGEHFTAAAKHLKSKIKEHPELSIPTAALAAGAGALKLRKKLKERQSAENKR